MSNVIVSFHWRGETKDLEERYNRVLDKVVEVSPARPLIHLAVRCDDGFRVYDVWTDRDVARAMFDNPAFRERLAEAGLAEANITVEEVHRIGWPNAASPMYR